MDDTISRQDAIKAVEEERFPVDSDYAEGFMAALDKVGWILKEWLPSAEKAQLSEEDATKDATSELISRREMLRTYQELCMNIACSECSFYFGDALTGDCLFEKWINELPSAEPERLTDDDFETIRIHLNAYKENLCNQQRWEEAEEYQRIIDRFMAFVSAERKKGKWIFIHPLQADDEGAYICSNCRHGDWDIKPTDKYCKFCGSDMRGEKEETE